MPYLSLVVSQTLDSAKKDALNAQFCKLITLLPGKQASDLMFDISGGHTLYRGEVKKNCAFVDVRLLSFSPFEAKREFTLATCDMLGKELGIEPSAIYINFIELPNWGTDNRFLP